MRPWGKGKPENLGALESAADVGHLQGRIPRGVVEAEIVPEGLGVDHVKQRRLQCRSVPQRDKRLQIDFSLGKKAALGEA